MRSFHPATIKTTVRPGSRQPGLDLVLSFISLPAPATMEADAVPRSKLELIPGGRLWPSDKSITEYYRNLNAHKDYNPWFK